MSDKGSKTEYEHVLALDTALGVCSVTYRDERDDVVITRKREDERGQAQFLVPMIQDVLGEAGVEFSALGAVVTTVGPGSFTGLRIGLSTARTFATTLQIPLIGISTLDLVAHQVQYTVSDATIEKTIHVVLETKRDDFYYCCYKFNRDQGYDRGEMQALPCDKITSHLIDSADILTGNATDRFCKESGDILPFRAENIVDVASGDTEFLALFANMPEWNMGADPIYLRGADVSQSKRKQRVMV